jgi:hypothetical protein
MNLEFLKNIPVKGCVKASLYNGSMYKKLTIYRESDSLYIVEELEQYCSTIPQPVEEGEVEQTLEDLIESFEGYEVLEYVEC